jgi:hypothetical protein
MKTTDLINALIFALADKEITKQLDAVLSRSNVSLTGFKIERLLELYNSGSLKGQQASVYTDMMQAPSPYINVAETAIEQHSGFIAELYADMMPLELLQCVIGVIEDDLKNCVDEYKEGLGQ